MSLLRRHHMRKPTKDLNAWRSGKYVTYTLIYTIPAVRVHEYGVYTLTPPWFDISLPFAGDIQKSGRGIWFAIDAYDIDLQEFKRAYALPQPPKVAEQDKWIFQPGTLLNIGIASPLGMKGYGGAIQAEFIHGSPAPLPIGHRKVRKRVHM